MGIRMGYVYLALPLSGALIVLFSLESIDRVARRGTSLQGQA
jgi:TRAP-type C4-dicarboxylate transport system permease small subunit